MSPPSSRGVQAQRGDDLLADYWRFFIEERWSRWGMTVMHACGVCAGPKAGTRYYPEVMGLLGKPEVKATEAPPPPAMASSPVTLPRWASRSRVEGEGGHGGGGGALVGHATSRSC